MSKTNAKKSRSAKKVISLLNSVQDLSQLPLKRFCTKKFYQVEFAYPYTFCDNLLLGEIVKEGKNFERLSDVHFITREDVLDLTGRLAQKEAKVDLPKRVEECARDFVTAEMGKVSVMTSEFLAMMTKLKIIESMYKVYKAEVINMQRRKQVHGELEELVRHYDGDKTKKDKKGKSKSGSKKSKGEKSKKDGSKKSKGKKSKEKISKSSKKSKNGKDKAEEVIIDDYTEIVLEENETIFDYNMDNHLQYFILTGFPDLSLVQPLTNLSVPIAAIIDVSSQILDPSEPDDLIPKLEHLFETPKDTSYLENTVWMKYRNNGTTTPKESLEEFLYVVKRINFIQRQHLAYIKNLKLCRLGLAPKIGDFECMEKYNRSLKCFPPELINVPLIVSALVQEVCWRESGEVRSLSDLTPSSGNESSEPKPVQSYQAHEEDLLKMGMRAYHETGRMYYDQSLEYIKLLQVLFKVDQRERKGFRTVGVSTEDECTCSNLKDLFDYFHLAIFKQMKSTQFSPKRPQKYYLTENLSTHNQVEEYEKARQENTLCEDLSDDLIKNYHMKEDLSSTVLMQLLFKATKDYSLWDKCYCEVSKAVLLRFHDNLNDCGVYTKLWDQGLLSPICVRDFCRFLVNEGKQKQWLIDNKLTDHEDLNEDYQDIQGMIDMHIPELYAEYQHLLGTVRGPTSDEMKKTFDAALADILEYPKSEFLADYCREEGSFLAYDLGPKICQLTGHTTIFHSDDGVKVTVDTTRFMVEDAKCSVRVDADGNSLVFHRTRPWAFHVTLSDETIVSFREFDASDEVVFPTPKEEVMDYEYEGEQMEEEGEEEQSELRVPNYNDYWIQVLRKSKISSTIPNFFNKPAISEMKVKLDDQNLNRLLELFKAAVYVQRPIYKISTKASLRRLKRTISPLQVPFVSSLKRVLFKPLQKRRTIGGYSVLNIPRTKKKPLLKYDFSIILPNGLLVTTLPRNKPFAEIKQEYKYKHHKELYRLFYSTGVVVVKNVDGTTTIMRSNGDIVELTDESLCHSMKCNKNMRQIFRQDEEQPSRYKESRCGNSPKETTMKTTFVDLYEFGDIPYTKKTLLQFEGKRIYVTEDRITEKQLYYVLSEHDYHTEEVFSEREDGMKCMADKKGKMTFQFPDGTKIISLPEFEKELVFVSKTPHAEGWVSVVINYKFEHPDYVPVEYYQGDRSTRIFLKDGVVKNLPDAFLMSTQKNVALEITSNNLIFLKSCDLCDADCICEIHLEPEKSKLLEVYDSYEKHFVCDQMGRCEINSNFIKTGVNKNDCNHRWRSEKQKFFVVNDRGPPGTLLWKDSFVESKLNLAPKLKHVRVANYMNKLIKKHTIEFFTQVKQDFRNRFTAVYKQQPLCLAKYKSRVDEPQIYYVTYRILFEFQNLLRDAETISELREFLETRSGGGDFVLLLQGIRQLLRYTWDYEKNATDKLSFQMSMKEESGSSAGSEDPVVAVSMITIDEIVDKWRKECQKYKYLIRNKIFPCYFKSDYFLEVLASLRAKGKRF